MPDPILTFDQNIFPEYICKELKKAGFTKPTAIQSVCWPIALAGMDVIAIAQTGSGKTLGFLMPLFVHIADQPLIKVLFLKRFFKVKKRLLNFEKQVA